MVKKSLAFSFVFAMASSASAQSVHFTATGDALWTLRARDGALLCTLPCDHDVPVAATFHLEGARMTDPSVMRVDVPELWNVPQGVGVDANVVPTRGNRTLAA